MVESSREYTAHEKISPYHIRIVYHVIMCISGSHHQLWNFEPCRLSQHWINVNQGTNLMDCLCHLHETTLHDQMPILGELLCDRRYQGWPKKYYKDYLYLYWCKNVLLTNCIGMPLSIKFLLTLKKPCIKNSLVIENNSTIQL